MAHSPCGVSTVCKGAAASSAGLFNLTTTGFSCAAGAGFAAGGRESNISRRISSKGSICLEVIGRPRLVVWIPYNYRRTVVAATGQSAEESNKAVLSRGIARSGVSCIGSSSTFRFCKELKSARSVARAVTAGGSCSYSWWLVSCQWWLLQLQL